MPHGYASVNLRQPSTTKIAKLHERTVRVNALVRLGAPGFTRFAGCVLGIDKRE